MSARRRVAVHMGDRHDPFPYDGPIRRVDGRRPYNHYLWPTEDWWAYHEPQLRWFSGRWHFGIVETADGRFCVEGFVWSIEQNNRRYSWERKPDQLHRANNFASRTTAIRTAAADLIRQARNARRWEGPDHLDDVKCADLVNWVRWRVARETDGYAPPPLVAKEPPPAPAPKVEATGLPLLDFITVRAA